MLVEYAPNPLAIGTRTPRFSWRVDLPGRDRKQTAYHLMVASDADLLTPGKADLWDSGKIASRQSTDVEYAGRPLTSNSDYHWAVQVWDESDRPTGFSRPQLFATALFDESDWSAKWIGMGSADEPQPAPDAHQIDAVPADVAAFEPEARAPLLRKTFTLDRPVRRARAFVCGLGLFELRLNGEKVGDDVLATPRTDFRHRALYSTYDVTAALRAGDNAVGLMLGNGWFNGQKKYWGWQMQWFGSPRAIVQLDIEYRDGTTRRIVTDESWQGGFSPITFNCLFDGEHYDARLEQPGWDTADFDAADWQPVHVVRAPGGKLIPTMCEPGRVVETLKPLSIAEPQPGVFVYDLGKNITGWVKLKVKGGSAGDTVCLHFGEAQHDSGALNAASNNAAEQRDRFTLAGAGEEVFEPRFTFHGFQFVEVTGYPGRPDLEAVTGCFVRTAAPQRGSFECANDLINQIHACTLQSQLCNIQMGVPTDDTQRPERQGWGCDAWAVAEESLYNLSMARLFEKWIGDFVDQQDGEGLVGMITPQAGAEEDLVWSAAFVLIPWWVYVHTGDRRILEDNYAALKRYMDYLERVGINRVEAFATSELIENKLMRRCGIDNRYPAQADRGRLQLSQWGDHLCSCEGWAARRNQPLSIATAFYFHDVMTMSRIADALGHTDDAQAYRTLAGEIAKAFHERFYNAAWGHYDTGTQNAQAWPVAFGLVPDHLRKHVGDYLVRNVSNGQRHLTTGYASTKFALHALSMLGRDDLVWQLATQTTYPSWGYMLRLNRTTSCENWSGDSGSLNHAPLGAAIDEWFYRGLAGIRPDAAAPGYAHIIFKPHLPADLTWARASLDTLRGKVASHWQQDETSATLTIHVPANATATVHIPTADPATITESNLPAADAQGVEFHHAGEGEQVFTTTSGEYRFKWRK